MPYDADRFTLAEFGDYLIGLGAELKDDMGMETPLFYARNSHACPIADFTRYLGGVPSVGHSYHYPIRGESGHPLPLWARHIRHEVDNKLFAHYRKRRLIPISAVMKVAAEYAWGQF